MSKQDSLFLLIKSLHPGEKALVRQIEQKEAGYLALFDLISRQAEYDERKLKKKLAALGHDINFAYAKNYLAKHILRTLRELRASAGMERAVQEVKILMERKVFDLAAKHLDKARKAAWDQERWIAFLELTQVELQLQLQEGGDSDLLIQRVAEINADRGTARRKLQQLGEFEDLYALYRPVVKRKQVARNERDMQAVQGFGSHDLLFAEADSVRARRMQCHCRILIHLYLGEYSQAHAFISEVIELCRNNPFLLDDHPIDFLNDLLRAGGMQLHFGQFAAVQATLHEIQSFQRERGLHGAELFDKYHRLAIALAIESPSHPLSAAAWAEIKAGLDTFRDTLTPVARISLLALMARLQFNAGNLSEARRILEQILAESTPGVREDIVSLARLMLVFVYSEKGDHELAESASKAARKYLQRREQLFAFEKRILRYFEQNVDWVGTAKELPGLEALHSDLTKVFEDKFEANVLAIFDIMAWIKRRMAQLRN